MNSKHVSKLAVPECTWFVSNGHDRYIRWLLTNTHFL